MKQRKGWRISCDVGEATENLENEQSESDKEGCEREEVRRIVRVKRVGERERERE